MLTKHDAFISYSHTADGKLARALEQGIERLAKPLLKIRAADVFRDETSLAANPSLWSGIADHLLGSEWFLLLVCPESANSVWCTKEVTYWLQNRSADRLLIVWTGGHMAWDPVQGDFDWTTTNCLSSSLRGRFQDEPLYVDLRWAREQDSRPTLRDPKFRDAVLNLAAPIRSMRKDELDGADVRQLHRNRLLVRLGVTAITVAAVIATWQAIVATRQARIAFSRSLSVVAQQKIATEPDVALLLAVHAARLDRSPVSKAALLASLQAHPRLQRIVRSGGGLRAGDFSSGSAKFATADNSGALSIWDAVHWQRLVEIPKAHEEEIWALAFLPDAKRLATGSLDKTVAVWDIETGRLVGRRMSGHTDEVLCIAVSTDGHVFVSGGLDGTIRFWDLDRQVVIHTLPNTHEAGVRSLAFSPDGSYVVSGGFDGIVRVWSAATGEARPGPGPSHRGRVMRLAFRPDGKVLATAGSDGLIRFWNAATWQELEEPFSLESDVAGVSFSPDGKQLAAGSWDGTVRLWNLGPRDEVTSISLRYHQDEVWQVAFSADGNMLTSASRDGTVAIWDTKGSEGLRQELTAFREEIGPLAFNPIGNILALGDEVGNVYLHAITDLDKTDTVLKASSSGVGNLQFSRSGAQLAVGSGDGTVAIWNLQSDIHLTWESKAHDGYVLSLAFSPDEKTLVSTGGDGQLARWDVRTGQLLGDPVRAHGAGSAVVAFSPTENYFASGGRGGGVFLWNGKTGQRTHALVDKGSELSGIDALAFSPDGRKLVAVTGAWLYIWDEGKWDSYEKTTAGHSRSITSLAFSPDSRTLFVGGMGGLIYLLDVESRRIMAEPLRGWPWRSIYGMALNPQATHLAASFGGGYPPLVWDLDVNIWIERACQIANRELRSAEWSELVGPIEQVVVCASGSVN